MSRQVLRRYVVVTTLFCIVTTLLMLPIAIVLDIRDQRKGPPDTPAGGLE